ncbi:MAG: DUF2867 domain-containing protein [Hoeflea sp.]|uniref:DUF2867 domain-containing protein n=1 Tax=Hoeflea sp. TaxID=1940281 RepID=UPI001D626587|nr:DUF2867 domain-containing protein [Hoeflea sp.]MBU4529874.1 DUF2867 domain-containing protein [Alphaproteobacteria bacterium]MBU4547105.1 DUF2867 domain-containing protein [Alphaproteobacteria bacterium]MBU4548718.1 DUF2867 domain-containing protein [Alphaproteobacteria bacterium]MBV1722367.1 DUF2867 domain-containing protein [Hoeflea sp.]MBV1762477.1 DUF2867 domain-containing protein [Hoeflea sp.]
MKAREITVLLPHPALPDADWGDCFEVVTDQAGLTAEQAARLAFGKLPAWTGALMAVRNLVVLPFGLKGDPEAAAAKDRRIGMFPIVAQGERELVLGFDDRHLDFRIVVQTEPAGSLTGVRLMTLVQRHNRLGRVYLAVIMPFHKLIVASTLSRVAG